MKKFMITIILLLQINIYSNGGDFWGINARNLSQGGIQVAGVDDYTAAFYNPAKLAFIGISNGIGYQYSKYSLKINLNDNRNEESKRIFSIESPKKLQNSYSSYTIGFTIPIFNTEDYGINVGFVNNYIENDVAKISIFDEKIYQFYRYHSNVETVLMNLGIGFKFLKHFSFGLGVAQLVSVVGETNVQFTAFEDSSITGKELYLGAVNKRAYNFSFFFKHDIYSIGMVYKQSLALPYKIPASIIINDLTTKEGEPAVIDLLIEGVGLWLPPKIDLGFSINLSKKINSLIHFNISYEFWSQAPAPYSFTSVNSDASLLLIEDLKSYEGIVNYKDSINLSLGYSLNILKDHFLNFGLAYRPSIIKNHDMFTNFVDTDIFAFSLGGKIKLLPMFNNEHNLYLNLAYSLQYSISNKERNDYYKSDVEYGGNIHLFYIDLSYE